MIRSNDENFIKIWRIHRGRFGSVDMEWPSHELFNDPLMNHLEFATELKFRVLFAAIMFKWKSSMLLKAVEVLEAAADLTKEPKDHMKSAAGVYNENLLVGHITIQTSSLCFHFLDHSVENKSCQNRKVPSRNWVSCSSKVCFFKKRQLEILWDAWKSTYQKKEYISHHPLKLKKRCI